MQSAEFDIRPPFDFKLSIKFCQRTRFEKLDSGNSYCLKRLTRVEGTPVFIEIGCDGTIDKPVGLVRWSFPDGDRVKDDKIISIARRILSSDINLIPFYKKLERSAKLKDMPTTFYGLKPILTPTAFESAAWAIIGQQVNLNFAETIKMRLVRKYGKRYSIGADSFHLFPEPNDISRVRTTTLKNMQFSQRKAEYLIGLAKICADKSDYLDSLAECPYDDAVETLSSIRGIGVWSANYILMRGVGHLNCLPLGDTGLTRAVRERYKLRKKPDVIKIEKLARDFIPYRSLYTLYLWFSL